MRLLLDQGLPRSAAGILRDIGIGAVHTGECGLATALDSEIIQVAKDEDRVILTFDSDFHTLMALRGATRPSIIRIRVEGLQADALADLVSRTIELCRTEIASGCLVSVEVDRVRIRRLPIVPGT